MASNKKRLLFLSCLCLGLFASRPASAVLSLRVGAENYFSRQGAPGVGGGVELNLGVFQLAGMAYFVPSTGIPPYSTADMEASLGIRLRAGQTLTFIPQAIYGATGQFFGNQNMLSPFFPGVGLGLALQLSRRVTLTVIPAFYFPNSTSQFHGAAHLGFLLF